MNMNLQAMLITSLKSNLTNPYSNVNAEGREILKKAAFRSNVEYLTDGNWQTQKPSDPFLDSVIYRIKSPFHL